MSRIFIGYRRDDSGGDARFLRRLLVERFGKSRVYMDIDSIPPGEDFVKAVRKALGGAAAALIVIGRRWLSPENRTRLHGHNDLVRQEIAQALRAELRVVPVLVDGADMPPVRDLPQDISALATRNAFHLRQHSFEADVQNLIRELEKLPGLKKSATAKRPRKPAKSNARSEDGKRSGNDSAPVPARKPGTRGGGPHAEKNRPGGAAKPRRAAKQPKSGAPSTEKGAKPLRQTTSAQPKTPEGRRPARSTAAASSGRKLTAKQPAPPASNSGRQGGRKRPGRPKILGAGTDTGPTHTLKPSGAPKPKPKSKPKSKPTSEPKPPAQPPSRSKGRGAGGR